MSLVQTGTMSSSIDSEGYSANSDVEDNVVSTSSGQAGTVPLSATDSDDYSANSMDVVEDCASSGQRSSSVNSEASNSGTNVGAKIVDIDGDHADSDVMNDLQVGRKFNSFEEVQELLDKLKVCNHPMHVFNTQSIDDYNKKRAKAKTPLEPVDSKWKFTYYVLGCVHFGQPRKRSNGIRCNQRHLAMQCSAKITISYDRKFGCLVLKHCTLEHNHRISSEIMKHYASNRN